jgi:1,4-dihydroxy-2-naphthoyl-CoA hydrolase
VIDMEQFRGALTDRMGIEILEASPDRIVGTMPVKGNEQPYGLLHGGASCVLAESLGSIGSAMHGAPLGKIAVGVDINATHHRGAREGIVTGVATALHLGRTTTSYEVVVTDDQERRICTARLTCQLIQAPPGS